MAASSFEPLGAEGRDELIMKLLQPTGETRVTSGRRRANCAEKHGRSFDRLCLEQGRDGGIDVLAKKHP